MKESVNLYTDMIKTIKSINRLTIKSTILLAILLTNMTNPFFKFDILLPQKKERNVNK